MAILSRKVQEWGTFKGVVFCLVLGVLMTTSQGLQAGDSKRIISEKQLPDLKAALVLKIAVFIEWPEDAPAFQNTRFPIGVLGDDVLFEAFQKFSSKKIHGRELSLTNGRVDGLNGWERILYFSASELGLEDLTELPPGVLTIGDSPDFNARGGMIKLTMVDGRPRFWINLEAARKAGLVFSSKLLKIATIYQGATS